MWKAQKHFFPLDPYENVNICYVLVLIVYFLFDGKRGLFMSNSEMFSQFRSF